MFINFSNHPSTCWGKNQIKAAEVYGEIVDIPFPAVPADSDEAGIQELADTYIAKIRAYRPACVLCQGEFTLAYRVIHELLQEGIKTVAACSDRVCREYAIDGITEKTAIFEFVRFREYGDAQKGEKRGEQ